MAVTVISAPAQGAFTGSYTSSYPLLITLSSNQVGNPNITQHRFKLTLQIDGLPIGYKNFIVTTGIQATADIADVVREYSQLANLVIHTVQGSRFLPALNTVPAIQFEGQPIQPPQQIKVTVVPGETYYASGVFVENALASFDIYCYRGFSDQDDGETPPTGMKFQYTNHYDQYIQANPNTAPGTVFRMSWPFTGYSYQCYPVNALRLIQMQSPALQYLIFRVYHSAGVFPGDAPVFAYSSAHDLLNLGLVQKSLTVYLPLFYYGRTNRQDYNYAQIRMYASSDGVALTTLLDYVELARGTDVCTIAKTDITGDPIPVEFVSLMYKDRFFRWSFFDMPLKSFRGINKTSNIFEDQITGRQDINTEGAEQYRVNTEMIPESQNKWIQDLFMSEDIYMIMNTGLEPSGEYLFPADPTMMIRVRITDASWDEQTVKNVKLIQYTFTLEKSLDLFTP